MSSLPATLRDGSWIGVDIGTSACKAILLDPGGRIAHSAVAPYPTRRRLDGEVTQDPEDWLAAVRRTVRACARAAERGSVRAIGLTAPAHVGVLVGSDGRALARALLAFDGRASDAAAALRSAFGSSLFDRTFVELSAGWTLPQLVWLRSVAPGLWPRIRLLVTQKDYVRFAMTGEAAVDPSDAAGTAMYDPRAGVWLDDLCREAGIAADARPPIRPATDVAGGLVDGWARALGLPRGTPVIVGATDTAVELVSVDAVEPGSSLVKIASTGTVVAVSDTPIPHPRIMTYPHAVTDRWYGIAATSTAAIAYGWLRELLPRGATTGDGAGGFASMDRPAARVGVGAGGVLFLPFLDGERAPYWDRDLRAAFLGLSSAHGRAHLCRAVLEGVAFSLRACRDLVRSIGLAVERPTLSGGGVASRLWREILVDTLGQPARMVDPHGPALGAAMLARWAMSGPGTAVRPVARSIRMVRPRLDHVPLYDERFRTYEAAAARLADISHALVRGSIVEPFGRP